MGEEFPSKSISEQTLRRLPYYLNCLREMKTSGVTDAAAGRIAAILALNEIQVRKDLAAVCAVPGKPKRGFPIDELIENIEDFLGYHNVKEAVLIGAGDLGRALLSYQGFESCGVNFVAAFEIDESLIGREVAGKPVLSIHKLTNLCRRMNIRIGAIAVPAAAAQGVCDLMVEAGILAIWNFAPVRLRVPEGTLVQNENLAASLSLLSKRLREQDLEGDLA